MSRFLCECGNKLSNSTNPNIVLDAFTYKEQLNHDSQLLNNFPHANLSFWLCPKCKRLHFFESGNDTKLMTYKLEIGDSSYWNNIIKKPDYE